MKKGFMTKVTTGILLALVVIPPFLLGGFLLKALVVIAIALSSYEIASLRDSKAHLGVTFLLFISMLGLSLVSQANYFVVLSMFLFIMLTISLFYEKYGIENVVYEFLCLVIISLACRTVLYIYATPTLGGYTMIFIGLACYLCDTGAYFFGVSIGKNKMLPRISPNKTWEGAIGGYLTGAVISFVFGMLFCNLPFLTLLFSSLLLPAAAEIGDLSFSSIKRHFHVKDFGSLFPGHGGVLDRIDSLLFCLMVFHTIIVVWGL